MKTHGSVETRRAAMQAQKPIAVIRAPKRFSGWRSQAIDARADERPPDQRAEDGDQLALVTALARERRDQRHRAGQESHGAQARAGPA